MQLHSLSNVPGARTAPKRKGRGMGSGLGKTSGKGHKGQMARKGHKRKAGFEGGQMPLIRRMPKRGFTSPTSTRFVPVNVGALNVFEDGTHVDGALLASCGLANAGVDGVKILGFGEISRKLSVRATSFSKSARVKIEAAGGTCEIG